MPREAVDVIHLNKWLMMSILDSLVTFCSQLFPRLSLSRAMAMIKVSVQLGNTASPHLFLDVIKSINVFPRANREDLFYFINTCIHI